MRTRTTRRALPVAVAAVVVTIAGVLFNPASAQFGDVVQFDAGSGGNPTGITTAPDGTMWFVDRGTNSVGHLSVDGTVELTPIPTPAAGPWGVVVAPDGNVWFTERAASAIGRLDPETGIITEIPLPTGAQPNGITVAQGHIWFAERYGKLGRIDVTTHNLAEVDVGATTDPFDVATAPDGTLWFTERAADAIGHYDPLSGSMQTYHASEFTGPRGITVADNGTVWFAEWGADSLGRLNPDTGNITEIPIPSDGEVLHPSGVDAGPGGIWLTLEMASAAERYKASAGTFDRIPLWVGGAPLSIATGPDGNLWVTQPGAGLIARITAPDTRKPTIDLRTPQDGATYALGDAVNADYSCADEAGGSGLASCDGTVPSGSAIDTGSAGTHTFEVDAADNEGNTRTITVSYDVVKPKPNDTTPPTISIAAPGDGATYTVGDTVKASYTCADEDGGSGLASCDGTFANGTAIDTSRAGDGSFTVRAADVAGNTSSLTVRYSVVKPKPADTTAPTISLDVPQDGAAYMVGDRPQAQYACADDGGSGLATCDGTLADGSTIDTSQPGVFTFTVRASDHAGNSSAVTHTYVVFKEWGGKLALPPAVNDVASGSAVPIWFNLGDAVAASTRNATSPTSTPIDCGTLAPTGPTLPASVSPTGGKAPNGRVMYVWKTDKAWAGTCRAFTLGIAAPTTLYLRFS